MQRVGRAEGRTPVAAKVVTKAALTEDQLGWIREEIAIHKTLRNPHICTLHGALEDALAKTAGAPDEPLPPGARAAFMLAHGDELEWQTVPAVPPPKGKRARVGHGARRAHAAPWLVARCIVVIL